MQPIKNPLISVIMSCHNSIPEQLKESIESILNQSYSNFELLVADNGETFNLKHFIDNFKDNRIKYIKNDPIIHPAASYDTLALLSKGIYVAIQDHDDISLPDRLQVEKEELDNNPSVQSVSSKIRMFGIINKDDGIAMEPEQVKQELLFSQPIKQPTFMKRKEFCNKYKYDSNWVIYDFEFWSRTRNIPHKIIDKILLKYRKDKGNSGKERFENIRKEHCLIVQRNMKELGLDFPIELCKMLDPFNHNKFNSNYVKIFKNSKDILLKHIDELLFNRKLKEIESKAT